ncbi:MAG: threonylcarbamoyl-AMP synthase [Acidobacteria bacterium]|nr:threonylcarbamoyl-AMP synthase [Acidobacteriota bacterium]
MDRTPVDQAVAHLRNGGVVAYPTDTLYGLAVDPRSAEAVRRLFAIKGREPGRAVPLIAADLQQAAAAGALSERAKRVADAFWPGPLSIVLSAAADLCAEVLAPDGSVAVRVPASAVARALAAQFGFAITATSANLSGEPGAISAAVVCEHLGGRIDMVLDGGDSPGGPPSTIIDLRGTAPRLVRAGAIAWDRVLRSIK